MSTIEKDVAEWVETGECPNPRPMTEGLYQHVLITMSDGRRLVYTGAAQMLPDYDVNCLVMKVQFIEPKPLPEGCSLGPMPVGDSHERGKG